MLYIKMFLHKDLWRLQSQMAHTLLKYTVRNTIGCKSPLLYFLKHVVHLGAGWIHGLELSIEEVFEISMGKMDEKHTSKIKANENLHASTVVLYNLAEKLYITKNTLFAYSLPDLASTCGCFVFLYVCLCLLCSQQQCSKCIALTVTAHSAQHLWKWHLSQHVHCTVLSICLIFRLLQRNVLQMELRLNSVPSVSICQYAICSNVFSDRLLVIFSWLSA